MRLYLVRHAEAARGDLDELRPLTAAGRQQARELGERLAAEGVEADAVFSSPLLRARETADQLARALGVRAVPDERLAPGATADDVLATVAESRARPDQSVVVVVGHQPDCGRIAAALGGGPEPPFPAAGMVSLDL